MLIKCNICNSTKFKLVYYLNNYRLFKCNKCDLNFVHPQPSTNKKIDLNYLRYGSTENENAYLAKKDELIKRTQNNIKLLSKYKKSGRLLDIGCSYGYILKTFQNYGYKTEGIEISKRSYQYAKKYCKVNVKYGNFNKFHYDEQSFDIVSLFDTLEHFSNPKKVIKKIHRILTINGIVIIQTPNFNSFISKIATTNWFWLLIPQHLYLFSIRSLYFLLENNGFNIIKITTWDDYEELDRNILYLMKLKDKGITSPIYYCLFHFINLFLLLGYIWNKFWLGGEITIYARKIKK